ncbi:MAG: acyltransferase family protein [Caulobacterales bacterium]
MPRATPASPARSDPDDRHTYATLDGLRGVAALAVVFYHFASDLIAQHGYMAVDIFFAMSGFVIASAYEGRLTRDLDVRGFLRIRLHRLAPLWILGVVIGLAMALAVPTPAPARNLILLALPALFLIPHGLTLVGAFPMNTSLWSLHVEMVVNLVYARLVRVLTTPVLIGVSATSFAALAVIAYHLDAVSYGTSPLDLVSGFLRALTTFPMGIVLWRLRARLPRISVRSPVILFAAALLMTGLGIVAHSPLGVTYDLAFIALAVPTLVSLAVVNEPSEQLRPFFSRLGSGSYALYALHQPIIQAARRIAADHGGIPTYLAIETGLLPGLILFAWAADRLFDAPLRRWLKTWRSARAGSAGGVRALAS